MQDGIEQQPAGEQLLDRGRRRTEPLWKVPGIPTSLVGREQDVADVCTLLQRPGACLLTLFGTGGVGKTRLALEVATRMRDTFTDGACFVHLAAINEPELVFPAVAEALTIQESGDQPLLERIMTVLQHKQMLLILDNIEQVISVAPQVEELLAACPYLKIVVTSREVLRVQGEYVFSVSPLALPNLKQLPPDEDLVDDLSHSTAIALFLQRVRASLPGFQLTPANTRAIAEICVRLDGLPLAIELVAAHIRLLPPQALLTRLSHRLPLLKQSMRTLPARQQTLRSTLDWSYNLLSQDEQKLFRLMSVFVGLLTLEAVEAVWKSQSSTSTTLSPFEGVSSLLDKSLLLQTAQENEEPSLLMLVTVREYALTLLEESGEAEMARKAHALYYLAWAEKAGPHLKGKQQVLWQARLEQEQENLRAAFQWCIEHEEAELACRFGAALGWFWYISGHWSEGRYWLEAALHLSEGRPPTVARAKALCCAGEMASAQGDYPAARVWIEESVMLLRQAGDTGNLSRALSILSAIIADNDVPTSRALAGESVTLAREGGDGWNLGFALYLLGLSIASPGSDSRARSLLEQSASLFRQLGDKRQLTLVLSQLGKILAAQDDVSQAETVCRESLVLARELGYKPLLVRVLFELAKILRHRGDPGAALLMLQESLLLVRDVGDQCMLAMLLQEMAYIACARHDIHLATAHLQASLALYHEMGETFLEAGALCDLGHLARGQGNTAEAADLYRKSIALARQIGHEEAIGWNLLGLAQVASAKGNWRHAARLFATAEHLVTVHADMEHVEWNDYQYGLAEIRAHLGEKHFAATWIEGRKLTPEQALAFQEESDAPATIPAQAASQRTTPISTEPSHPFGLTPREREVLRLVSKGLTNVHIAEQLMVSPLTINAHVRSIYNKLDVTSRAAATRFAIEHHLV